ncbi:nucleotide kinase domain-containing protein [Haloarcula marina]|uniref:nucleotide kinase domain-containing protein n=1 Tax=Haloarcula marina TaxID=2961574 RepID=UPI0020B81A7B|nr:nucleotide kinase domain-containing protein [Halomicroarcula marina]
MLTPDEIRSEFNTEPLDLFWKFIHKRQNVWHRRVIENKSPPWTDDQILQNNRFTNIYRQLDPGTQYAIQNILERDASREDKIFNIMMYRLIGRLETHEDIGFQPIADFDKEEFEDSLKHRRDVENETVFTGAYMVAGYNQMGSSDKVENIAVLFNQIASNQSFFSELLSTESAEQAYKKIRSQQGFGNFLSYQVLVDLLYPVDCYNGQSVLPFSPDDWSSPGPGAQKGIKRLIKESTQVDDLRIMNWLRENQQAEFDRLGLEFPYLSDESGSQIELSLADIQNCLCEFYKYDKILNSEGRARRRFRNSEGRSTEELRSIYEAAPRISLDVE